MKIEISIIVPVYNLESLLRKCVDSILEQSFTNFELILVNDGSTDQSGEICDEYASKDSRVRVIHKKNGGVASSRNAGLSVANGNYIGFVDNDDYINKYMFETLYHGAVSHTADIIICDYVEVGEKQHCDKQKRDTHYHIEHYNHIEACNQLYTTNNVTFVVPWNKLYKKSLFKEIEYKVGNINDDETVAHELLYRSNKVTYIQTGLYYYVQREGSQMDSTASFNIKRFDAIYAFSYREKFFRQVKEKELHEKALKHFMEKFFWYYYLAQENLQYVDKELKLLKRVFDQSLIHILRHKHIGWKQKIMCIVFSINPSLFEFIRNAKGIKKQQRSA
jgi:glycosyltransferase involved in cell wall biosynthesis